MGVEPAMESPVSAPLKTDVSLLVHEQGVSSLSLILKVNRRCQLTPTNKPISALMCTAYLPCAAVPCHLHYKKKRDRTWYICAFVLIQYRDFQTKNVRMTPNLSSRSSVLPPPFLFFFLLLLKYDRLTESPTHVSYIYIGLKTWGNIKHSVLAWLVNKGGQRVVVLPRDEKLKVVGKILKNVFQSYNTHFVKRLWNLPFKIDYEISWKWQTFCFCIKKTGTFKNDIVVRPFGFPVPVCTRPLESITGLDHNEHHMVTTPEKIHPCSPFS